MVSSDVFSSVYHKFIHHDGGSVFSFLEKQFPTIPENQWTERAAFGGLYVNGLPVYTNEALPLPACIEYYEPKYSIKNAAEYFPAFSKEWIVFEDQFFIACYKPARLPTMPAKEQTQFSLRAYLDQYVGHAVHCPSRLDTSTQGLVIASKDIRTHGLLQKLFEQKKIRKEYRFITPQIIDWETFEASEPIGKSTQHPVLRAINGIDAKKAFTRFEKVLSSHSETLIRALPQTGRTHQIRVHASSHGFPIKGDKFYGSSSTQEDHPLCLLSYALTFTHPVSEQEMHIEVPERLFPAWFRQ